MKFIEKNLILMCTEVILNFRLKNNKNLILKYFQFFKSLPDQHFFLK